MNPTRENEDDRKEIQKVLDRNGYKTRYEDPEVAEFEKEFITDTFEDGLYDRLINFVLLSNERTRKKQYDQPNL